MNIFNLLLRKNEIVYLNEDENVFDALKIMKISGYTAVPVISRDGTYAGTVSEGDFLWRLLEENVSDAGYMRVRDLMAEERNPSVDVSVGVDRLIEMSMNQNFIPVVDDKKTFIGIITRSSIINGLCEDGKKIGSYACGRYLIDYIANNSKVNIE